MEWSGAVGEFISTLLSRLVGRAGGAIAVCVGMFITAMIGADIDVHQLAERHPVMVAEGAGLVRPLAAGAGRGTGVPGTG